MLDDCTGSERYPVGSPHLRELPVLTVPNSSGEVEGRETLSPLSERGYV